MPHQQDTFIITLPPRQPAALQGWQAIPAHLAYQLGPGPRLLRADCPAPPRGGLMVVGDGSFDGLSQTGPVCREIVRECQAQGFSGAVLDFEGRLPPLDQIASQLDREFHRRGWRLVVPERCGRCTQYAQVAISSALSGGSLQQRLEEAGQQFGRDRVALALEKAAEDFLLPSPTGSGQPLSPEQLRALMEQLSPAVFFSGELCARYFTYMSRESGAHFVLFDDGDTLVRKLEVARRAGVRTFLAPWADVSPHLSALGVARGPAARARTGR